MKTTAKIILFGVLCGLLFAGGMFAYRYLTKENESGRTNVENTAEEPLQMTPTATPEVYVDSVSSRNDVSDIAENFMPAIVAVNVKAVEPYYDFFGRVFEQEYISNASGIIVAQNPDELLIVTNNHVVEDAKSIKVTFIDGTESEAFVKAVEEGDDLAVISVNFSDMDIKTLYAIRVATLGDSESLCIGEMVVAMGNALGYGQSTTVGYVSALNREIEIDGVTLSLIQTDTAINPGNSGGALLNAYGEVVGINNAKLSDTSVEGMCFAIPVSHAIPIIEELITREVLNEDEQAYIGIIGQTISEENAQVFNMPRGIYVKEVREGSPAETAGLKAGYIITHINNKKVYSQEQFEQVLSYTRGNSEGTVTVMVLEKGVYVEHTLSIVFGTRED